MQKTVHKLCADHPNSADGLKVLNVGFGLGIVRTATVCSRVSTLTAYHHFLQIDSLFQSLSTKPSLHVIIEPHPDVLNFMRDQGWYEKEGVKVLEGKWQDFVESDELLSIGGFDVIYTDTFSEDYSGGHLCACLPTPHHSTLPPRFTTILWACT